MLAKPIMIKKKEKGFILALTMMVLLALSSFSIAMLAVVQTSSDNRVRAHQSTLINQAAEFGLESGRLWLVDQMSSQGTSAIVISNTQNTLQNSNNRECLKMHGYSGGTQRVYFAFSDINQEFANVGQDARLSQYSYDMYVQKIGNHTTSNGWNYIPTPTEGPSDLSVATFSNRRLFYRVIACGYGPNRQKIVPLQLYLSVGGDGATGNVARSVNIEGYYRQY
jgi:Tfp pilus assembly protein PilX